MRFWNLGEAGRDKIGRLSFFRRRGPSQGSPSSSLMPVASSSMKPTVRQGGSREGSRDAASRPRSEKDASQRSSSPSHRAQRSAPGGVAGDAAINCPDAAVAVLGDCQGRCSDQPQLVSGPLSGSGRRLRSHGGLQRLDGFPDLPGVSMDCRWLRFRRRLSDEREPGHQFECGIIPDRGLGGRHMALKHHFGAWRQCGGRHGKQLSAEVSSGQGVASSPPDRGHNVWLGSNWSHPWRKEPKSTFGF